MFVDSVLDVWIFKLVALLVTGVIAVVLGNYLYDKAREKK